MGSRPGSIPRWRHAAVTVGKSRSSTARPSPVASSQRWSAGPSPRSIRRCMTAATTSRGARSPRGCRPAMTGRPAPSTSTAPAPRRASVISGHWPAAASCHSTVGWNCTNSTSRSRAPARAASARPSPVRAAGLVVVANAWPKPPVARTTARAVTAAHCSVRPSRPATPTSSPRTAPRSSVSASRATPRVRISTGLASSAAATARCTSAPAASPPACTIRLRLCPPSRCSAVRSSRAPSPARRAISAGACDTSAATAAGSHSPAPASSVSRWCRAAVSPGPIAAARPPWASGVAPPPTPLSLVISSTRRPCSAAASAALMPAAPEPTTTTSASRSQRGRDRGR